MSEARIWHGGDLDEARQLFPQAPEPWIDLSTGINPIAYPMPALPALSFERLPSPTDHRDLEEAAAKMVQHRVRRLPVVDGGELVGIVTLDDIAVRTGNLEVAQRMTAEVIEGALPDFFFNVRG